MVVDHMKEDGTELFCFVPLTTARGRLRVNGIFEPAEEGL